MFGNPTTIYGVTLSHSNNWKILLVIGTCASSLHYIYPLFIAPLAPRVNQA